jgi:ABC-type uncharacterized transport system substrate-binding protein
MAHAFRELVNPVTGCLATRRWIMPLATLALALVLLAAPLAAAAQPAKTIRIGWLSPGSTVTHGSFLDAFRQRLRELGYVEGRDLAIESRWAEGKSNRLPSLAAELVGLKEDVIVAAGAAIRAVKEATTTIPIVMAIVVDPVATGLVYQPRTARGEHHGAVHHGPRPRNQAVGDTQGGRS